MYDVLIILAAIANIGTFLFQIKQEIQNKRLVKADKRRASGN